MKQPKPMPAIFWRSHAQNFYYSDPPQITPVPLGPTSMARQRTWFHRTFAHPAASVPENGTRREPNRTVGSYYSLGGGPVNQVASYSDLQESVSSSDQDLTPSPTTDATGNMHQLHTITSLLRRYGVKKRYDIYEINVCHFVLTEDDSWVWPRNCQSLPQVVLFSECYNRDVSHGVIPPTTRVLILGKKFNRSLDNLFDGIEVIIFPSDGEFNQSLDNLPVSVVGLVLNRGFDLPLDLLPSHCKIYRASM